MLIVVEDKEDKEFIEAYLEHLHYNLDPQKINDVNLSLFSPINMIISTT